GSSFRQDPDSSRRPGRGGGFGRQRGPRAGRRNPRRARVMSKTADETSVAAANLAFYRALEARDLSAMELVWTHEESASCVHPGWHRLDGWSEVRRSWENIFANARPWSVAC